MIQDAWDGGDCISLARAQRLACGTTVASLVKRMKAASAGIATDVKPSPQGGGRDQTSGASLSYLTSKARISSRPAATARSALLSRKPAVPRQSPIRVSSKKSDGLDPGPKLADAQTSSKCVKLSHEPGGKATRVADGVQGVTVGNIQGTQTGGLMEILQKVVQDLSRSSSEAVDVPGSRSLDAAPETLHQRSSALLTAVAQRRESLLSFAVQAVERALEADRCVWGAGKLSEGGVNSFTHYFVSHRL